MKVEKLIELLEDYRDFEVETSIFELDNSEYGMGLRQFKIEGITGIGYSDKTVILNIEEIK